MANPEDDLWSYYSQTVRPAEERRAAEAQRDRQLPYTERALRMLDADPPTGLMSPAVRAPVLAGAAAADAASGLANSAWRGFTTLGAAVRGDIGRPDQMPYEEAVGRALDVAGLGFTGGLAWTGVRPDKNALGVFSGKQAAAADNVPKETIVKAYKGMQPMYTREGDATYEIDLRKGSPWGNTKHAGFFSGTPDIANYFAAASGRHGWGASVYPTEIKFKNPIVIDGEGRHAADFQFGKAENTWNEYLTGDRYRDNDGIILRNVMDAGAKSPTTLYIPKYPKQIKQMSDSDWLYSVAPFGALGFGSAAGQNEASHRFAEGGAVPVAARRAAAQAAAVEEALAVARQAAAARAVVPEPVAVDATTPAVRKPVAPMDADPIPAAQVPMAESPTAAPRDAAPIPPQTRVARTEGKTDRQVKRAPMKPAKPAPLSPDAVSLLGPDGHLDVNAYLVKQATLAKRAMGGRVPVPSVCDGLSRNLVADALALSKR